jgi:two-component system OmpR family sensor kinase
LRRLLPDSLAGRITLVLVLGLTVSHLASLAVYQADLLRELGVSDERKLADRLATTERAIAGSAIPDRDRTAHAISGGGLEMHWSTVPSVDEAAVRGADHDAAELASRLRRWIPDFAAEELRATYSDRGLAAPDHPPEHALLISTKLPDGSWINYAVTRVEPSRDRSIHLLLSATLMAAAICALSILSVRSLTAPFRVLARAAERLGVDVYAPPLPEKGPREVRNAAHAFNGMQERIRKLVAGRTEMLAAVSHDLRTPITRLRLRADFVEDKEQREKMFRDLDEMEAMISSTLAFLGEEARTEETRVVDVAAMLDTICDEMADSGLDVRSASEVGPAPLRCRPLALKRAFTNLIDNAVKYGGKARVLLNAAPAELAIDIEDPGPGIPEREQERVFSPFYRIESSRSRGTGGAGLGLTVARAAIRSHGGEIELANLPEGGFRVSVKLPRLAVHENSEYQAPVLDPY